MLSRCNFFWTGFHFTSSHLHIFIKVDVVHSWSAKYPFWNKLHQVLGWKDGLKTTPDIWEIFMPDISKVIALFSIKNRKATPIGDILRRARHKHTEVNNLNWTPNKFIHQMFCRLLFLPGKYWVWNLLETILFVEKSNTPFFVIRCLSSSPQISYHARGQV